MDSLKYALSWRFSRGAATECGLGRQPGVGVTPDSSPEGRKIEMGSINLAPLRGWDSTLFQSTGLRRVYILMPLRG